MLGLSLLLVRILPLSIFCGILLFGMDWKFIGIALIALVEVIFKIEDKPIPPPVVYCYVCRVFDSSTYCDIGEWINSIRNVVDVQAISTDVSKILVVVKTEK